MESWIFKPKYGKDIYKKVIEGFADDFLDWYSNGVGFSLDELDSGYVELQARIEEAGSHEYFSETCHHDEPISGNMLTHHMMVLLVEAGVAYKNNEEDEGYILEDVDICDVLAALSEDGTSIFSLTGARCYVYPVGNDGRQAKFVNLLDALLSLDAA